LQKVVSSDLHVQEFDGSAWVAIVPFLMVDVMRGSLPSLPPLRRFPELNVRTYVERNGRAGVWFFSLDADCWPIVLGGRSLFRLPYFKAKMSHAETDGYIRFSSERRGSGVEFRASYQPTGPAFYAAMGSFEHWVAERYCLYSPVSSTQSLRLDVHHRPWPLQEASVVIEESDLLEAAGLSSPKGVPICHFSEGVEVISYSPERPNSDGSVPP